MIVADIMADIVADICVSVAHYNPQFAIIVFHLTSCGPTNITVCQNLATNIASASKNTPTTFDSLSTYYMLPACIFVALILFDIRDVVVVRSLELCYNLDDVV